MSARAVQDSSLFRARAAYEGAFHKLASEIARLRMLTAQSDQNAAQVADARARVEAAQAEYSERRNLLAELLLARRVQGAQGGLLDGEHDQVKRLAHLLWETSSGRAEGRAESDWYRAEELFRMLHARVA